MKNTLLCAFAGLALFAAPNLGAHCQVPCGIYDDNNVIQSMHTDWITIEKASKTILELQKDPSANAHQLTRWVTNKESHAQAIQEKVLNYFLAQRLKPTTVDAEAPAYIEKLTLCHKVIVTAMKCKQSTDPEAVAELHNLLHEFETQFGTKEEKAAE
ncbi:MAG: superoxide dismutase [Ni] [Roseibacillus sp.]